MQPSLSNVLDLSGISSKAKLFNKAVGYLSNLVNRYWIPIPTLDYIVITKSHLFSRCSRNSFFRI